MDESGGQFVEQTTHIVDLASYLVGDVKAVTGLYATRALMNVENLTVPDVGSVLIEFENGAIGTISNTCILQGFGHTVGLHIYCSDMVLEEDGGNLKVIQQGQTETIPGGTNANLEENKAFIHAVKTKDRSGIRSPYADALKSLAVSLAANESAKKGKRILIKTA
jgi:predicted dehydrogenase